MVRIVEGSSLNNLRLMQVDSSETLPDRHRKRRDYIHKRRNCAPVFHVVRQLAADLPAYGAIAVPDRQGLRPVADFPILFRKLWRIVQRDSAEPYVKSLSHYSYSRRPVNH